MGIQIAKLRLSTTLLVVVGLFDLLTTLLLLQSGMREANPFFSRFLEQGPLAFIVAKLIFIAGPIALLEIARKYSPRSAEQGAWMAVCCYLMLYAGHLLSYMR